MENKNYLKNRYALAVIAFVILLMSANLTINLSLKRKDVSIVEEYVISKIQLDYIESVDVLPFFELFIPLSTKQEGLTYKIHPEFINGDLKSIEIQLKDSKRKNILLETIKARKLMYSESSMLKWALMKEYRRTDYDEFKKNTLYANKDDYSWWNLYSNLKLLLYIAEKEKSIPEGLKAISILTFKDYNGYLEEYKIDSGDIYFGYNFVIGKNYYNIIISGYSNKTDVLELLRGIKIIKNAEHEYNEVIEKYKNNGIYPKEFYLLSAISLMPDNSSLYEKWKNLGDQ
jgi:hypothetical protein